MSSFLPDRVVLKAADAKVLERARRHLPLAAHPALRAFGGLASLARPLPDRAELVGALLRASREGALVAAYRLAEEPGEEGFALYEGGEKGEEAYLRWQDDRLFAEMTQDHETPLVGLHRYIWRHWPLSHLARRLGLHSRAPLGLPRAPAYAVGGPPPDDVGSDVHPVPVRLTSRTAEALRTMAQEQGCSVSEAATDLVMGRAGASPQEIVGPLDDAEVLYLPRRIRDELLASAHGGAEDAAHHHAPAVDLSDLVEGILARALRS